MLSENDQPEAKQWDQIIAIAGGGHHFLGLSKEGKVFAAGSNKYGQCNTGEWDNIKAIAAGDQHSVGLCSDGSVVATGNNDNGQCDVGQWRDVKMINAANNMTYAHIQRT